MMNDAAPEPVLQIDGLGVSFEGPSGERAPAVDGISLSVYPGQTLALVGESGCGKSVTALSVLGLLPTPPATIDSGSIVLCANGKRSDLRTIDGRTLRRIRGGDAAMIFQEPMTSLNPVMTIGEQVIETIRLHQRVNKAEARRRAVAALAEVGIDNAGARMRDYPHEFSGGQRQRVMIAMALACEPALLLADEPTTALDVTIQAQILDLLERLQRERGLAILLITHDLGVVAQRADTVCVMYAGRIVEAARAEVIFTNPTHPYTAALLGAIPSMTDRRERLTTISDATASPESFTGLPGLPPGAQAWWPHHPPPEDIDPDANDKYAGDDSGDAAKERRSSLLAPVAPEHWVACWRAGALREADDPHPAMPPRAISVSAKPCSA